MGGGNDDEKIGVWLYIEVESKRGKKTFQLLVDLDDSEFWWSTTLKTLVIYPD